MEIGAESGVDVESRIWPKEYSGKCSGKWSGQWREKQRHVETGNEHFQSPLDMFAGMLYRSLPELCASCSHSLPSCPCAPVLTPLKFAYAAAL